MCRPLIPFWIETPASHGPWGTPDGPWGMGVTAFSFDDALDIIRWHGFGRYLPTDLTTLHVIENVRYVDLNQVRIHSMGSMVVRGMWFPFLDVGPPDLRDPPACWGDTVSKDS